MVEVPPTKEELIFLVQVKKRNLEYLLSKSVREGNIRLELVETFKDIIEQKPEDKVIAFIIGSDVQDPIQTAQRLHTYHKDASIIIFAEPEKIKALKEVIKFSPFIGTNVFCLDESKEAQLEEKLNEILKNSQQAAKYQDIIAESNIKVSLDASSQKSANNQKFINKLMDLAPIGIVIVGSEQKVLGWNKKAASIFEKNETQILGKPLSRFFAHGEANKLKNYLRESFENQATESTVPLSLERKSQGDLTQFLNLSASPFTYSRDSKKALILAIKDVTERKQAQKDLQQLNDTLEQRVEERTSSLLSYQNQLRSLASRLSKAEEQERQRLATEIHDNLGQMLAVNKMRLDALPKDQLSDNFVKQIEEVKQGIVESLRYARNLMSELKPPPSLDKEDITATIRWLANKMEKYDLKVIVEDDNQPKRTLEDIRITLLQSVREVLFNVIRHTDVKKARLSMSRLENQVQIIVKDEGKGFDTDNLTFNSDENTGFGLFNISERMDLIGGYIDIDSKPGKGTKVTLVAPLKENNSARAGQEKVREPFVEEAEREIKVMLVDDHEMVRKGLKKIVEAEDDLVIIAEASDGEEAVELARKTLPDIVIMDVDMPRMNGIDATKKILSFMSDVRIIALSLHDQPEVKETMRRAGATAFLSKSEAFEALCATIRTEAG